MTIIKKTPSEYSLTTVNSLKTVLGINTLGDEIEDISEAALVLSKIDAKLHSSNGVIGSTGDYVAVTTSWAVRFIFVVPGEQYRIKATVGSTGSSKHIYAFFSSLPISSSNYLSGDIATTVAQTIDITVTVPSNAIALAVTDHNSQTLIYAANKSAEQGIRDINNPLDIVLCGDSLSADSSGYSSYFSAKGYNVLKYGVGGEHTLQILGRTGFSPLYLSADLNIPADTSAVSIFTKSSWNNSTCFLRGTSGFNPVIIRGIPGTVTIVTPNVSATFARTTAGTAITAKQDELILPYSDKNRAISNQVWIVWIGQNGGWTDENDLIDQFQSIADKLTSKKYLFITPHQNTTDVLEAGMIKRFGTKYLNMRKWCVKYGLDESGITPTTDDDTAIAAGNCPPSLLSDGVHFVTAAKQAQAVLIKNRLVQLGYIKQ